VIAPHSNDFSLDDFYRDFYFQFHEELTMMNARNSLRYAATCLLVCLTLHAHADANADARKAIQAAYDRNSAAGNKRDLAGSLTIYTPDYVSTDKSGKKTDLKQMHDQMKLIFGMFKTFKVTQSVQSLQLKGNEAQITLKSHLEGTLSNPQTKQAHTFTADMASNETWVKTPKGWLNKRSNTISEKEMMDGKPLPGH
jgi:ketosteroid isomerase-like protein